MKTHLIILSLLLATLPGFAQVQHDKLPGSTWKVSVNEKELGTLTLTEGGSADLSWTTAQPWSPTETGIEILGTKLRYADKTFSGVNGSGNAILLTFLPAGEMAAKKEDAKPFNDQLIDDVTVLKLSDNMGSRFSIDGRKTAFGKSTSTKWQSSWGSYIKDFERQAKYVFDVSHFGSKGTGNFEVLFLGKNSSGEIYPYAFESRKLTFSGDLKFEFDMFLRSNDSNYQALNIRILSGSKPDSWVAWFREGNTIMGLSAARGSLVDKYERNLGELLTMAKSVPKR